MTACYRHIICLLSCLIATGFLDAQHPALSPFKDFRFEQITDEDGLSNAFVTCAIQDKRGFIWFGTAKGLNRFDGYQFKKWIPEDGNPNSLSQGNLWALYESNDGAIWIGTDKGLNRFDPATETFARYFHDSNDKNTLSNDLIIAICEDNEGNLWVGTGDGLCILQKGSDSFKRYFYTPGDTVGTGVRSIIRDESGCMWFGARDTLYCFNPADRQFHGFPLDAFDQPPADRSTNFVKVIFLEDSCHIWLSTDLNGIYLFNKKTGRFEQHFRHNPSNKNSLYHNRISSFLTDEYNRLWIGSYGGGWDILDRNRNIFFHFDPDPFNPAHQNFDIVRSMLKDNAGNIWLGTFYGGAKVVLKHKKPFVNYQPVPGKPGSLEGNTINKLTERPDGSIWVPANGKGLALFDPWKETFRHIPGKTTATNNTDAVTFLGVLEDTDHNAWAITFNEIWKIDGRTGQWKNMKPSGMPSKGIWLLMQFKDSGGTHWIGTQGGLYSYDHKANAMIWHSLNSNNQVKEQGNNANIQDIFESPNGDLWVATYGGANRLKRGSRQFEYFPFHRHILCIHRDNNDVIWFGTVDGMAYFNATSGKVEFYPKAGSLRGQVVHSILEDNLGRFWFGTGTGILCFDPISCLAREYNQKDGVVNRQFFGTHLRSKTGEFYFGGTKGLLRFHPDSIRDNAFIPPIVLTNFQVLNKDVPIRGSPGDTLRWKSPLKTNITYTENIDLPYWQNDFAFEFAALDFTAPLNNRYKFRLEGYDTSWVETSAERRFAHYTNISPGTYTFTVLGSNSDGKWNETGASVRIVVNPPWYTTWWASLFYFVAFIGLLLSIRRFELNRQSVKAEARRLEELDAVKSRLYTNITHEFRTPLTIILGLAEQLKASASESVKTGLDMIYRNGQRVLQLVNQMLDLAKVESGHLKLDLVQGDVVVYMKYLLESFHSLAENKHMRLHFRADITTLLMDFDPERLQTVVSNLLSNALKFTPEGGDVYFMITQIEENRVPQLQLKVRDTGPGIPEETLPYIFDRFYQSDDSAIRSADGTGIGLTLTRELVKLMQGQISAKSPVPGNTGGTEFTVVLPVLRTAPIQSGLPDSRPATPASAVRPASGSSGQPSNKPLVLLVEDNPDVVRYLQTCLHSGYRIETTFDGVQGIEKALESVPDLIISDVMMPRKDGFEVCRVLKNDERTSHIPIILLTAKADIESRLVGLKRGADAYLAKPFHKEELLVRIYNLLEVRRRLQTHYLTLAGLKEGEMPPGMVVPEHEMEDAFIQKVRELIEADFSVQWQVPELAHKLLVSTTQLHRKLAALTGMHTTEFVRHVRLTKASQLLRSKPDERISAIASESGFENVNEFNRRFKEVFGMPPGEWRKGMG